MDECNHEYEFLESGKMDNGTSTWIFYCKKCLDIRMKSQSIPLCNVD